VKAIKADLKKDLLRIDYDPNRVVPRAMVEEVGRQGFEGRIVPDD